MTKQQNDYVIDKIQNYKFKNPSLLNVALTHSSFSKINYERFEFLGDSILDLIVGEYLFLNTEESEGSLTKLRAQFVSETYLAKIFDRLNIEKFVNMGKSYQGEISSSIKADIVEAIIASVYLDSNFEKTKKFAYSIINLGNYKTMKSIDFKSQLQEFWQSNKKKVSYRLIAKTGASHNPSFEVGVYVDGQLLAKGSSSSKHKAEQQAAKVALGQTNK